MQSKKKKQIKPLRFRWYFIPVLTIALVGFFDSIYLAVSHYRVHTDLSYSSFCAISRALNCDTVSSSPYAVFFNVPVAIWGSVGYGFVLFILGLAANPKAQKKRLWPTLFWVSMAFGFCSLVLAWISSFWIRSYCIMCILTYMVNFFLIYYAWFVNKRFGDRGLIHGVIYDIRFLCLKKKLTLPVLIGFFFLLGGLVKGMPRYWDMSLPLNTGAIYQGITEEGHPWIGAKNPELVIEEFTDYLCSQCRIKHFSLRRLMTEHPGKIRLIHRHFPMDHEYNPLVQKPYHIGSGTLALFSIYAQTKGKFWEANDMFFQLDTRIGAINTKKIAHSLGLNPKSIVQSVRDPRILHQLRKDIKKGLKHGLRGTPGYIINGKVYQGYIPPRLLRDIIE